MKRALLLATTLLGFAAPMASAQAQQWSGFYAGVQAGYNFQPGDSNETILFDTNLDGSFADTVNTAAGVNAFSTGFCGGRANSPTQAGGCLNEKDGVDFGVRFGYDWQFDNIVVGGLADISFANINDSVSAFSITPARYTMTRELNWSGALRARVGLAMTEVMPYVTGGVTRADIDHSFSTSNAVNTFTLRGGGNTWGYQLGAGLEWNLMPGWRVGAEYLYTTLDDDGLRVRSSGPAPATNAFILVNASGTDFARSEGDFDYGSLRLTLSYRFGG